LLKKLTLFYDHVDARDSERDNLQPQQQNYGSFPAAREPKTSKTMMKMLGFFLLVATSLFIITVFFYPSTEQVHDRIRRKWEAEERDHQSLRDAWSSERKAMVVERTTWQKERESVAAEREKERADHILEREAAAAEREQWRKDRIDRENQQRQEEEEKRALIVWENLSSSTKCLRYGTREYSATLSHVPFGLDPLAECWKKSIDIHGRQILPSRCDTQGMCGTVTGHWIVDFSEPTCVTWWRGYDNKGCVERGIHRYESVLENLQWGDDWHVMCATTPGQVQGRSFDGPTSCASWRSGINGIWLVEDANCS